uniref:Uncharacterized protein n=1 Tax=Glossina pallidipes TaxID=7398 RepID=A0A1A9ZMG1_GLOPL
MKALNMLTNGGSNSCSNSIIPNGTNVKINNNNTLANGCAVANGAVGALGNLNDANVGPVQDLNAVKNLTNSYLNWQSNLIIIICFAIFALVRRKTLKRKQLTKYYVNNMLQLNLRSERLTKCCNHLKKNQSLYCFQGDFIFANSGRASWSIEDLTKFLYQVLTHCRTVAGRITPIEIFERPDKSLF